MAKKNKLPKRILGVKVPKAIRRGAVGKVLGSPAGQALLGALAVKAIERLGGEAGRARNPDGGAAFGGADMAGRRSETAADAEGRAASGAADARLNFKHALAEGARHFLLGLSYPKSPKGRSSGSSPARPGKGRNGPAEQAPPEIATPPH
jgi:hypothetical protein